MAKFVHDDVLDNGLAYLKSNGGRICLCSAQPTTYDEAITTYKLADVDITSTNFTGPANGDTSGRKLTCNQQTGVAVDTTGTATHVAIVKTTSTTALLTVTTCTSQSVTQGNTCTINAHDLEIADVTP